MTAVISFLWRFSLLFQQLAISLLAQSVVIHWSNARWWLFWDFFFQTIMAGNFFWPRSLVISQMFAHKAKGHLDTLLAQFNEILWECGIVKGVFFSSFFLRSITILQWARRNSIPYRISKRCRKLKRDSDMDCSIAVHVIKNQAGDPTLFLIKFRSRP